MSVNSPKSSKVSVPFLEHSSQGGSFFFFFLVNQLTVIWSKKIKQKSFGFQFSGTAQSAFTEGKKKVFLSCAMFS